jgi:hypothetical protein
MLMADSPNKPERVVYDEKPVCGRCGNTIIGVVPRIRNGKPVCRDCIFELDQLARRPGVGRIPIEETTPPLTSEEKAQRAVLLGILAVLTVIFLWRAFAIAPLLKRTQPLRNGTYGTDATTDRCIEQLWKLSKSLQENRLPDNLPSCPETGRPYVLEQEGDDTVIRCPNPGEHGLEDLWVSRLSPIPTAVERTMQ